MQIVGDAYVKDEFKRHKSANQEQTAAFMEAWAVSPLIVNSSCFLKEVRVFLQKYCLTISKQINAKRVSQGGVIGKVLNEGDLDQFSGEQLVQLYELYEETSKPHDQYPKME